MIVSIGVKDRVLYPGDADNEDIIGTVKSFSTTGRTALVKVDGEFSREVRLLTSDLQKI